ncbi:MAG: hypothetical protein KA091_00400 [Methanoregulaceae archaeon]|nr:hypothetical protein [Methanoregulaceae archaeon]
MNDSVRYPLAHGTGQGSKEPERYCILFLLERNLFEIPWSLLPRTDTFGITTYLIPDIFHLENPEFIHSSTIPRFLDPHVFCNHMYRVAGK